MRKAGKLIDGIELNPGPGRGKKKVRSELSFTELQFIESNYSHPRVWRWQLITKIPQEEYNSLINAWRSPQKNFRNHGCVEWVRILSLTSLYR